MRGAFGVRVAILQVAVRSGGRREEARRAAGERRSKDHTEVRSQMSEARSQRAGVLAIATMARLAVLVSALGVQRPVIWSLRSRSSGLRVAPGCLTWVSALI